MKRWLLFIFAAVLVAGFSTTALAAVEGTHHDMGTYVGAGYDACYACHGYKETAAATSGLGNVGAMCYSRCHLGSSGVATNIPLASFYPEIGVWDNVNNRLAITTYTRTTPQKYQDGHKMVQTAIPSPDTVTAMNGTGWPYTTGGGSMECTSCHDVHSATFTPFLRSALSDNTTGTPIGNNAFCHRCHAAVVDGAARWAPMSVVPNGAHPSEVDWWLGTTRASLNRLARNITFKDKREDFAEPSSVGDNAVFRNLSPNGLALTGAGSSAVHYNPGGKLGNFGLTGPVGCYTCHVTHLPAGAAMPQLINASYMAAGTKYQSDMCVACHGTGAGVNPGTTLYYHPVDNETRPVSGAFTATAVYTVTTGSFNITVNMAGVNDNGASGRLTCMSCHGGRNPTNGATAHYGVHVGNAGTSILSPVKPTCVSCHVPDAGTAVNSHHVTSNATRGATYAGMGYTSPVVYSGTAQAALTDGIGCEDCHVAQVGNSTAHNWN